jgi:hypothetical protein
MKNAAIPKKMREQAKLRALKTPDVLAQQAVLNTVLRGRKGGSHRSTPSRREQLAMVHQHETLKELQQ